MSLENKLFKKLVKVLSEVDTVQKSGFNSFQNYQYVTESDLIDATKKALVSNGVFVFTSVEESVKIDDITSVVLKHTFVCSETGEQFSVNSAGQGQDKGDKGVYKACTGAMKYFLSKNFLIAGEDDPENEKAQKSKGASTNKPTYTKPTTTSSTSVPKKVEPTTVKKITPKPQNVLVGNQVLTKSAQPKANF